ncbi:MAG: hypothetical protein OQK46_06360 [Gammaproteobacteria bacterium]|nr:hypothetical protein [Gammaproteobacteria bacterium]
MYKPLKNIIGILAGFLIAQNTYAALFSTSFDSFNDPYLNVVDFYSEVRPLTSVITDGILRYEDTDSTGDLSLNSNSSLFGDIQISNAAFTTNSDGSLHVIGVIDFLTQGSSASFTGDMSITASWDEFNNVTTFDFATLAFDGSSHNGFLMTDGLFTGNLLEFHASSSLLAIIDNPFPVYSPVPVPAAIWLFASGFLSLTSLARIKKS